MCKTTPNARYEMLRVGHCRVLPAETPKPGCSRPKTGLHASTLGKTGLLYRQGRCRWHAAGQPECPIADPPAQIVVAPSHPATSVWCSGKQCVRCRARHRLRPAEHAAARRRAAAAATRHPAAAAARPVTACRPARPAAAAAGGGARAGHTLRTGPQHWITVLFILAVHSMLHSEGRVSTICTSAALSRTHTCHRHRVGAGGHAAKGVCAGHRTIRPRRNGRHRDAHWHACSGQQIY